MRKLLGKSKQAHVAVNFSQNLESGWEKALEERNASDSSTNEKVYNILSLCVVICIS